MKVENYHVCHLPISATDMTTGVMTSKGQSGEVTGRVFYRNHRLYPPPPDPGARGR